MKPRVQYTKNGQDMWYWHAYNDKGEMLTRSMEGYATREEAEQAAATTMTAIIDDAVNSLSTTLEGALKRLKPVIEAIIVSAGQALRALEEMGYYNKNGMTQKGNKLIAEMTRQRLGWTERDLEISKKMPDIIKSPVHIPVQHNDQPQVVAVRVK
jgi:uncharacterized protein YegP (UPF0339 family)